jgi:hypothetical protein
MGHYKEADRKSTFHKQVPSILTNYPKNVSSAFSNFLVIIIDKLNAHLIQKDDAISFLKYLVAGNFPEIKIIPIIEAETHVIIHTLKLKNS